jgi:rare lipoprotein A
MTSLTFQATYYGKAFHGNTTTSGEIFDMNAMTCASNVFPFGTILKVVNVENGKSVVVRVTDRGDIPNHVIDLSEGAFSKIANLKRGRIKVSVKPIKKQNESRAN